MIHTTDISLLRRKLIYRSSHRGCKETDIILERFALKYVNKLSMQELTEYEKIVNLDDYDLYCYITNNMAIPCWLSKEIFSLISHQD